MNVQESVAFDRRLVELERKALTQAALIDELRRIVETMSAASPPQRPQTMGAAHGARR
jgi:uncharacterized coiled-coil protein SlyX